jgi:hypothetical protein
MKSIQKQSNFGVIYSDTAPPVLNQQSQFMTGNKDSQFTEKEFFYFKGLDTDVTNSFIAIKQLIRLSSKALIINLVADGTDVDTTSGVMTNMPIPLLLNGTSLIRATAHVSTAGTTNATTIQVRNMTKHPSNDALSTAISIASGSTTATAGVIDTVYDKVSTDDRIKIYVTANSTTKPKGLYVVLEYNL